MTPGEVEAYLADAEAAWPEVTEGAEKRVIWAGKRATSTPLSLVYVHGFSATSEEIRPVPDLVAKTLGANLFFTRLTGHGLSGEALAEASVPDWMADMEEVMAVGRAIGGRVVLLTCSTGGTLATLAAAEPHMAEGLAGIGFVSPNFGLNHRLSFILTWPGVHVWGPWIAGRRQGFEAKSEAHDRFWTLDYPTQAVFPMAEAVALANRLDHGAIRVPALFQYANDDQVVDPRATDRVRAAWGGPVTYHPQEMAPGDDELSHVIAGDILSPSRSKPMADQIIAWVKTL